MFFLTLGYKLQEDGSLHIDSADVRDGGIYICAAQNNAGTSLAQVRLEVQGRLNTSSHRHNIITKIIKVIN